MTGTTLEIAIVELYDTFCRGQQAHNAVHGCGFSHSVATKKSYHLSSADGESDIEQCLTVSVKSSQITYLKHPLALVRRGRPAAPVGCSGYRPDCRSQ